MESPFLYLIAVFYGLLLLALPVWLIALSVRSARHRRELSELKEESQRERLKLQRAIGELQNKLAAAQFPHPSAEKPATEAHAPTPATATPVTPPAPAATAAPSIIPRTIPTVPVHSAPLIAPRPSAPPAQPTEETAPKPSTPALVPPTPPADVEPKSAPPAPPKVTSSPTTPHPPAMPATPPPAAAPHVPPAAAAPTSTPFSSPLRASAPQPTLQDRIKRASSIEETLGANWLAKIGVVMLVIGIAYFGIQELRTMGPAGIAFVSYVVSFVLLIGGIFLERNESYQLLGKLGIGGGWAVLFWTTYAIHNVRAMHVLDSLATDCVLMLAVAIAMGVHTLRYKSQLVTGMAFLLGYTTVALSFSEVQPYARLGANGQSTAYGLAAGVMLSIGLVFIVLKMGWFELEIFGLLSSYLNHLYWLYRILGVSGAHGRTFPEYHISLAMLFFYWLIFRISYVSRTIKNDFEERVSTVAAVLNSLLLLGLLRFQSVHPELAYLALFAIGAFELAFALLPVTRQRRRAFVLLSVIGSALIVAAVPSHYTGNPVAILWLVGAEVFLAAGIIFEEVVFRRIGLFTGVLVGTDLFGFNFHHLFVWRARSEAPDIMTGVLFGLCAVVLYFNALYIASRWEMQLDQRLDRSLLILHSYIAAAAGGVAAWALFSNDWTAVAFAVGMFTLTALNRRVASVHLQVQCALAGLLTLYRALVFNIHIETLAPLHIATRLITLPLLGALFYATAKLSALRDDHNQRLLRAFFSFAGAAMFGFLIWTESPALWIAPLFLLAAIILALAARRLNLFHLALQEHCFAAAALLQTLGYNYRLLGHYGPFSLRLITVSLVAAGLYAISRRSTVIDASYALGAAYLHTTAATFLLAYLMWYETTTWLSVLWALFALVLTTIDRRFQLDDLRWQAHALAAVTMMRCLAFSIYINELWHDLSVRLLTLALVAVIFYSMSLLIRLPQEWRARDFHHLYSWAASFLVSLLLWYELDPVNRALGWAIFGLVLFEYGFLRKIAQYRYQSYVAFAASFVRIFFANLAAGRPGDFFSERLYTVLPLILIFFFVYAQLSEKDDGTIREKRFRSDVFVAYLGTATLTALCYFQFDPEWVVVAYASIVFASFALAWALRREVFLHQGILLTLLTLFRGLTHNLFGGSLFRDRDWSGRYFVIGTAIAVLLATLFCAFQLRESYRARPSANHSENVFSRLVARPEQLQFFAPIILLTVMLALKAEAGWITVFWGIEGVLIILFALSVQERSFRLTGLGLLLLCVGKVITMDAWRLDQTSRYITFIIVGVALIAVSSLYIRFRESIRQYL